VIFALPMGAQHPNHPLKFLEKIIMPRAKNPSKKTTNGDARSNGSAAVPKKAKSALQTSSASDSNAAKANVPLPSQATDTSVYPSVSEEQIRRRAYELYTQRGGHHGRHVEDWFRAESELLGRR
jgi:hypothetical protein